jgi:hypothetical protein
VSDAGFYFGLLFGLRAAGITAFLSDGAGYHNAYGEVVKAAKRAEGPHPHGRWFGGRDLLFGTYREASELVSWGMRGGLLTLDSPGYAVARLSISSRGAEHALARETEHGVWFRQLGQVFADALKRRGMTIT